MPNGIAAARGIFEINLNTALARSSTAANVQGYGLSSGTETLDNARGSSRVVNNNVALNGQNTVFGPFDAAAWAKAATAGTAWNGGSWMGRKIAGLERIVRELGRPRLERPLLGIRRLVGRDLNRTLLGR